MDEKEPIVQCPYCSNEDPKLIEIKNQGNSASYLCVVCSKDWSDKKRGEEWKMTGRKIA